MQSGHCSIRLVVEYVSLLAISLLSGIAFFYYWYVQENAQNAMIVLLFCIILSYSMGNNLWKYCFDDWNFEKV
jgi:hypothetical protein